MARDVHLLEAGRGGMDGEERDGVVVAGEGADHEGFGVGLVFDGAEVGRGVGVGDFEGLQGVDVELGAVDVEADVAVDGKSVHGLSVGQGCGSGAGTGGEEGDKPGENG